MRTRAAIFFAALVLITSAAPAANRQWVEGFDKIEFHHGANGAAPTRDFRGTARGYMTAGWWIPGEMKQNYVSWKTAKVPAKQEATFVFVGATSVLPSEFTRGPSAKLSINGKEAITFTLGCDHDQVDTQPIILKQAGIFGDPQRNSATGDRSIRCVERFKLLSGCNFGEKNREQKHNQPYSQKPISDCHS